MKYTVDTLIFDFDGVLVDTGPDIANAVNFTMRSFGLAELPAATIIKRIGGGAEVLMRRCLTERSEELIGQALQIFTQRYKEYCCVDTCLYPGVKNVLEHYRVAGKHMAIATQKKETITQTILNLKGIAPYFEVIVGPETFTQPKPHPESVQRILDRVGTAPQRAIMIGDMVSDIKTGKAAGTLTCGVLYGYGVEDDIRTAQPDVVLENLTQMLDWVI